MKNLAFKIDDKLHRDFKVICAVLGVDMQAQLQALMVAWIKKNEDKLPMPERGK